MSRAARSDAPSAATAWAPATVPDVVRLLADIPDGWWLSGGVALDRWLGTAVRPRLNTDVSTTDRSLPRLLAGLPTGFSAWTVADGSVAAWDGGSAHAVIDPPRIYSERDDAWVLQLHVEDGTGSRWLYRRDPRLQLPWSAAVLDIGGVPTGAPEVQLLWKALRPRPEDDQDKDAVLPALNPEAHAWWERAVLTVHPHSTWAIRVRSPHAPAKASWNRPRT